MTGAVPVPAFLAEHGFAGAVAVRLPQDAGFRRYLRLLGGPRPAVLMLAPPADVALGPFLSVAAHLSAIGLSVPEILAADEAAGLLLLEDLSEEVLAAAAQRVDPAPLYEAAAETLAALHAAKLPRRPGWSPPLWDGPAMIRATGASLFDWWWPARFGAAAPAAARAAITAGLAAMLGQLEGPPVLVHRDYFGGNLFWLPDRAPPRRIGIIDFQDAAAGPAAYDLVSLVEDARQDIPKAVRERAIACYLARRPEIDPARFGVAMAVCAAQRHLRVSAQWVRLARRDGKPHYLAHGPRSWALLAAALAHPATAPLAAALDRWIPPAMRANPDPEPPGRDARDREMPRREMPDREMPDREMPDREIPSPDIAETAP